MQIIISNSSDKPIYEQIAENIKENILNGALKNEEMLPSIRTLAKDLRISNITTKKAYEKLVQDGFIEAVPGKGYFVKNKSRTYLREEILSDIEFKLEEALNIADKYNISKDEVLEMLKNLM